MAVSCDVLVERQQAGHVLASPTREALSQTDREVPRATGEQDPMTRAINTTLRLVAVTALTLLLWRGRKD